MSEPIYWAWGLLGAALIVSVDILKVLRERRWEWPPECRKPGWWVGQVIRLALGAGVALALGAGDQLGGIFGAIGAGAAAPAVVEKIASGPAQPADLGTDSAQEGAAETGEIR